MRTARNVAAWSNIRRRRWIADFLRFLREREIVHYQRFAEALHRTQERLDSRNFYACNPAFDKKCGK